jgi:hypothetical protein
MGLLAEPILKKFFVNKIESSRPEWGDYLLKVADIFSTFDGENLDRELRTDRFLEIGGRSLDALRDVSNYRDEFGAYGTYLGVFRVERIDNAWKLYLSNAAKHYLCSTEPDVESFCRTQMALFQYPNGIGAVQSKNGSVHMQANARDDTVREVTYGLRVNPLRLLCRVVVALHEIRNIELPDILITYEQLLMLMNDDRINKTFTPDEDIIASVLDEYSSISVPRWVEDNLTHFKRNFHILEWTGLFLRDTAGTGLVVRSGSLERVYSYIVAISDMTDNFTGFDLCYGASDIKQSVINIVSSPAWGRHFDALTLPLQTLHSLTEEVDISDISVAFSLIGEFSPDFQTFPELRSFQSNQPRAFIPSGAVTDPYETIIRREKANSEHSRILNMLAAFLRLKYADVFENTFIDLFVDADGQPFIFEVKSNNSRNVLSQIRKAIAQLYEYRYRRSQPQAKLCIVLQEKPPQEWVIDYLLNDRQIFVCWLVDDTRLECPADCHQALANIGIVG